jgi:hypothetical protein
MRRMSAVLVVISMTSCTVPRDANNVFQRFACERNGGIVKQAAFTGRHICVAPFKDGGKKCLDSSDCEGECLTYASLPEGTPVQGMCEFSIQPGGCFQPVTNGVAGDEMCE